MTTVKQLEHIALERFLGSNDSGTLIWIDEVLSALRRGESEIHIRTTYHKIAAVVRGSSGFATITVTNPEWCDMGTGRATLPPTRGHVWKLKIERKSFSG